MITGIGLGLALGRSQKSSWDSLRVSGNLPRKTLSRSRRECFVGASGALRLVCDSNSSVIADREIILST
jgi:hypothetical protein